MTTHVCDYLDARGRESRTCHLDGDHGGRCRVCEQTARRCGHQPHRLTVTLCAIGDCRSHRLPETSPCLVRREFVAVGTDTDGIETHTHRCALPHAHGETHRCRSCGREYETERERYVRLTDPLYVVNRAEAISPLVWLVDDLRERELGDIRLRVGHDPSLDHEVLRARLVEAVRDLDWMLRLERVTATPSATGTVTVDQPTEPIEPTEEDERRGHLEA